MRTYSPIFDRKDGVPRVSRRCRRDGSHKAFRTKPRTSFDQQHRQQTPRQVSSPYPGSVSTFPCTKVGVLLSHRQKSRVEAMVKHAAEKEMCCLDCPGRRTNVRSMSILNDGKRLIVVFRAICGLRPPSGAGIKSSASCVFLCLRGGTLFSGTKSNFDPGLATSRLSKVYGSGMCMLNALKSAFIMRNMYRAITGGDPSSFVALKLRVPRKI